MSKTAKFLFILVDIMCLLLAVTVVSRFRLYNEPLQAISHLGFWFECFVSITLFYIFGCYDFNQIRSWKMLAARLGFALAIALGFVIFIHYFFGAQRAGLFGRGILFGSFFLFGLFTVATRVLAFFAMEKDAKRQRWLFVSSEKNAAILKKDLGSLHFPAKWNLLTENESHGDFPGRTWNDIDEIISEKWSHVVVAEKNHIPAKTIERLMRAKFGSLQIMDIFEIYEQRWKKVPLYMIDNSWFLLNDGFKLFGNPIGLRLKRLLDIAFATIGIIVSLPIMILVGIAIKLDSSGPIIYRQIRTGKNGKLFTILKFRTMTTDAEKNGAVWAKVDDPRITRIGNFLRKTRLDELPQFFNIVEGSMSFVGPRPERPEFNSDLAAEINFYDLRHLVSPGLTGWAQIMYPYGASMEDAKQKLQFDLFYIKNHSLWLDISIILRTIKVVCMGRGR